MNSPSDRNIRLLNAEDAEKYRPFRLRSLREHPEAFSSSFEDDILRPINATRERLVAGGFLGAFDAQDQIIGAVGLVRETGIKIKHIGTVIGMYVVPQAGRQGVGKALLQRLIEHARSLDGLEQMVLTVTTSNTHVLQLYQNTGFEIFGQETRAMKVGEEYFDKTHMILFL